MITNPNRMDQHERAKMRAAAFQATRVYPGAVGEMLKREIIAWEEFGFRFTTDALMNRLIAELMKAPTGPCHHTDCPLRGAP